MQSKLANEFPGGRSMSFGGPCNVGICCQYRVARLQGSKPWTKDIVAITRRSLRSHFFEGEPADGSSFVTTGKEHDLFADGLDECIHARFGLLPASLLLKLF